MRKFILSLFSLVTLVLPIKADVTLPSTLSTKVGHLLKITAKLNGDSKAVKWINYSEDSDLVPFPEPNTNQAIFTCSLAGTYKVGAYTADNNVPSDVSICTVVVINPGPPSPPNPNPPVPPSPPTPTPTDPLFSDLSTAFSQEVGSDKLAKKEELASLYKTGANTTVNDKSITTVGQLLTVMHTAANNLIGSESLPNLRKVISVELNKKLPTTASTPLDETTRKTCGDQFARVANLLNALK